VGKNPISEAGFGQYDGRDSDSLTAEKNDIPKATSQLSESVITQHLILKSSMYNKATR
jgi:hypothetical protein